MSSQLRVGEYLLKRVHELGVKSIFGVPGDYELALLDLVLEEGFSWKGNPNELIAAYAADGYARVNGVGALVTTFGPGETSAICGIAGSYTEFVPVVHIVGYPSMRAQRAHTILHHTTGEGIFHNYHRMYEQVCCATTILDDAASAGHEIDRVLNAMLLHSQPVYIGVPTDVAFETMDASGLLVPLVRTLDPNNVDLEIKFVAELLQKLDAAENPIIIVDGGATRNGVLPEVDELVDAAGIPVFTTPMGKGAVDERSPHYGGTYGGAGSTPEVKEAVETADCVLWVGNYPVDLNTGEFTQKVAQDVIVDFERFYIAIGPRRYNLKMKHVLPKLAELLRSKPISAANARAGALQPYAGVPPAKPAGPDAVITQAWFWPVFGKLFLREGDLLVTETGTSAIGMNGAPLPGKLTMWTQSVFGSIGYAAGAVVGASVANVERGGKRSILVTGEGSLQMTIQAFSDILRHNTNVIIFVINNTGYTVERVIHGKEQPYNDVALWEYTQALEFFGPGIKSESYVVRTPDEAEALLSDPKFAEPDCTKLVEVFMGKFDAPQALLLAGEAIDKFNAGKY